MDAIYDCHLHTEFSADSETPVRDQLEKAISLGMKEICITDHHDPGSEFCPDDFTLDIPSYIEALRKIRDEYAGRIRLNVGIELGLQNHVADYLHNFGKTWGKEFDFVIGSSHFVDRMDPYDRIYWDHFGDEKKGFRAFFEISLKRVQNFCNTDIFDTFAHLDFAVRYAPHKNQFYSWKEYESYIRPLLKLLIENGKCLECNTGGIRYGLGDTNPCAGIFRLYKELGGELITIGSDAHTPENLGIGFDYCREMLKDCGFHYYAVFHERKAEMLPL